MCAQSIKAAGGRERDWKKVRKQWFDLKDKAKKLKTEMGVTGNWTFKQSKEILQ